MDWVAYQLIRSEAAGLLKASDEAADPQAFTRAINAATGGDWKTAAKESSRECQFAGSNSMAWHRGAIALLMADDVSGYERHCREMIDRFSMSETLNDHERTVKTCLLRPGAVELSRLPMDRIETAAGGQLTPTMNGWINVARTLFALRSGDVKHAQESLELARDKAGALQRGALCFTLAALIDLKIGDSAAARGSLAEANKLLDASVPRKPDGTIDFGQLRRDQANWLDWLNAEILRREAAAALSTGG